MMNDVCYECGKVQDYGTMQDVSPTKFDIFCDRCITNAKFNKLSDRAKQIYGNVEDAMQDAEEMEGVSGMDYIHLMEEIINEATKRKSNHERLMDESLQERY
jgi:hypothetical protein